MPWWRAWRNRKKNPPLVSDAAGGAKVESTLWSEQYNKPKVAPSHLQQTQVLGAINKVTFSAGNIKALCVKGQRA